MNFDWMTTNRSSAGRPRNAQRIAMYRREIVERAGIFYRLGYSVEDASARLRANADWDFEIGTGERPEELNGDAIGKIVAATFSRRPAH